MRVIDDKHLQYSVEKSGENTTIATLRYFPSKEQR